MSSHVVVLNIGSSSVKADLFTFESPPGDPSLVASTKKEEVKDFDAAIATALDELIANRGSIAAVGHRVVHGGEESRSPVAIDEQVLSALSKAIPLAPLHNPSAIRGIAIARRIFPAIPHYAVLDTAFHVTLPEHARRYAVSKRLFEEMGVRRYGFHGTSHAFVARRAAELLQRPLEELRLITLHLGNGASVAAIRGGRSIDTSMGMTPLEGLVMGTRPGDLDPGVPLFLEEAGWARAEIEAELQRRSGLRGLTGTSDMRDVARRAREGDEAARMARTIYAYRIKKYVGAYFAILGGLDAIVFTGGIGENDAELRVAVCDGLEHLGVRADGSGSVAVLVVATDEELEIARQLRDCVSGTTTA